MGGPFALRYDKYPYNVIFLLRFLNNIPEDMSIYKYPASPAVVLRVLAGGIITALA